MDNRGCRHTTYWVRGGLACAGVSHAGYSTPARRSGTLHRKQRLEQHGVQQASAVAATSPHETRQSVDVIT